MEQDLGKLLLERRKELGLTQEEVAGRAGIPRTTYLKIENGNRKNPRYKTLCAIAEALNLDFSLPKRVTYTNKDGDTIILLKREG